MCGGNDQRWCLPHQNPHTGPKHLSLQQPGVWAADCLLLTQLHNWTERGKLALLTLPYRLHLLTKGGNTGSEPLPQCGALQPAIQTPELPKTLALMKSTASCSPLSTFPVSVPNSFTRWAFPSLFPHTHITRSFSHPCCTDLNDPKSTSTLSLFCS